MRPQLTLLAMLLATITCYSQNGDSLLAKRPSLPNLETHNLQVNVTKEVLAITNKFLPAIRDSVYSKLYREIKQLRLLVSSDRTFSKSFYEHFIKTISQDNLLIQSSDTYQTEGQFKQQLFLELTNDFDKRYQRVNK